MRIATFNLENLGDRLDRAEGFAARVATLRPQLHRLDADILCLQEVNATRQSTGSERRLIALDKLVEGTRYAGFFRVATHHPATGRPAERHNLVILSRWPIAEHWQYFHDFVLPPTYSLMTADPPQAGAVAIQWDRPILHARIARPHEEFLDIVNVHLRAPLAAPIPGQKTSPFSWKTSSGWAEGFCLAAIKRAGQALEVRMLVDRIFDTDPEAQILVAGDFNAEEREVPVRTVCADLEDTSNGDLGNRVMIPLAHNVPSSRRHTVIHRGRTVMYDHMLASRSLLADFHDMEIHNEALGDELVAFASVNDSAQSYHAPVVATFRSGSR